MTFTMNGSFTDFDDAWMHQKKSFHIAVLPFFAVVFAVIDGSPV